MNYLFLTSFSEVLSYVFYILIALLILLIMISVHELGHYIVGKIFHFKINEFAIGFGPKIFKKVKKDGEIFSIRLIPLGGFCSFESEEKDSTDPNAFNNKKPWQRILVLLAGVFMNYVLSIIVICLMFGIYGHSSIMSYEVSEPSSYGTVYDLQERDVIIKANGKNIYMLTDLMNALEGKNQGEQVEMLIYRGDSVITQNIKLRKDVNFKNVEDVELLCDALGVTYKFDESGELSDTGFRTTGIQLGFFATIGRSFEYSFKLASSIFEVLGELITGKLGIDSLGGTVTTISVTANAVKTGGFWAFLNITALIGVNLALFNVIPFPALDGSKVVLTLIEWIFKKPVNRKIVNIIDIIGFVILIAFAVFVDVQQLF